MLSALIIDGEAFVRELLSDVLVRRGYEVKAATDGAEGVNFFRDGHFSIVILDASLTDMDAVEALARIRVRDANVPVVMMIGPGYKPDQARISQLGAVYLPKPFSIGLLHTVLELMEGKRREWLEAQTVAGDAASQPLTGSAQDRRRHLRAAVNLYASVVSDEGCRECRIIDISLGGGGLHFLLDEVFATGTDVTIIFLTLPHEEPLSMPATIVWESPATKHCGAVFHDLDWRNALRLEAIITQAIVEAEGEEG